SQSNATRLGHATTTSRQGQPARRQARKSHPAIHVPYPQNQTSLSAIAMSALCQKQTLTGFRQKLCRIPSIVRLMPFSFLVGLPMFTVRFREIFLVAHAER